MTAKSPVVRYDADAVRHFGDTADGAFAEAGGECVDGEVRRQNGRFVHFVAFVEEVKELAFCPVADVLCADVVENEEVAGRKLFFDAGGSFIVAEGTFQRVEQAVRRHQYGAVAAFDECVDDGTCEVGLACAAAAREKEAACAGSEMIGEGAARLVGGFVVVGDTVCAEGARLEAVAEVGLAEEPFGTAGDADCVILFASTSDGADDAVFANERALSAGEYLIALFRAVGARLLVFPCSDDPVTEPLFFLLGGVKSECIRGLVNERGERGAICFCKVWWCFV